MNTENKARPLFTGEFALASVMRQRDELREELRNERQTATADRLQLQRLVVAITAAMPHFKSAMANESDHAVVALASLVRERNTLRTAIARIAHPVQYDSNPDTIASFALAETSKQACAEEAGR